MMVQLSQFLLDAFDPIYHCSIMVFAKLFHLLSHYSLADLSGVLIQFDEFGLKVKPGFTIPAIGGG